MQYRFTIRLTSPDKINFDLLLFVLGRSEPRVAYSRGDILPGGGRAEKSICEFTEYADNPDSAISAIRKGASNVTNCIASLRNSGGIEQFDFLVTIPTATHLVLDGQTLMHLALIPAQLECRVYEEADPMDPHWKVETAKSGSSTTSPLTHGAVSLRFTGVDLKRDAVHFCFLDKKPAIEYYRGDVLPTGCVAEDGKCEFKIKFDPTEAATALRSFIDQVVANRQVILEHFMAEETDFVINIAARGRFVIDSEMLSRIALLSGRLEIRSDAG